jgi:hypothetical protein
MSDLSPKIDLKRTLLRPHSPIAIFDARHNSAAGQCVTCHAPYCCLVVHTLAVLWLDAAGHGVRTKQAAKLTRTRAQLRRSRPFGSIRRAYKSALHLVVPEREEATDHAIKAW